MLSEVSLKKTNIMISHTCGILIKQITLIDMENKLVIDRVGE